MNRILAPAHREVLAQFVWSNPLLAFDFDGTLSPIVREPHRAALRRRTRQLLTSLSTRFPVAVISGRARVDLVPRLGGIQLYALSGNHGLEPSRGVERYERIVRRWISSLQSELGTGWPGVELEDKRFSLAIHYRRSRRQKAARSTILEAVSRLGPLRVIAGKKVVNLVPEGAPHKGMALQSILARSGCDTAIYLGDDETDEDVFALERPPFVLGIRVGRKRGSLARYFLQDQPEVDRFLALLLKLRDRTERGRTDP